MKTKQNNKKQRGCLRRMLRTLVVILPPCRVSSVRPVPPKLAASVGDHLVNCVSVAETAVPLVEKGHKHDSSRGKTSMMNGGSGRAAAQLC